MLLAALLLAAVMITSGPLFVMSTYAAVRFRPGTGARMRASSKVSGGGGLQAVSKPKASAAAHPITARPGFCVARRSQPAARERALSWPVVEMATQSPAKQSVSTRGGEPSSKSARIRPSPGLLASCA